MHQRIAFITFIVISICEVISEDILFSESTGEILYNKWSSRMKISCKQHIYMSEAFPPFEQTLIVSRLEIYACIPPPISYAKELNALNINASQIETLKINFNESEALTPGNYTEGLNIQSLYLIKIVRGSKRHIFDNNDDFLEPLFNLTSLEVEGLGMPPLPWGAKVKSLTLKKLASVKDWGNCAYVRNLDIDNLEHKEVPLWAGNCSQLTDLSLIWLPPETVRNIATNIQSVGNLRSLDVTYCRLYDLPLPLLAAAKNLTHLKIMANILSDTSLSQFPVLESLSSLDLNSNKITGSSLEYVMSRVPALKSLNLNYNPDFRTSCIPKENENEKIARKHIAALEETNIENLFILMDIEMNCYKDSQFSKLENIKLKLANPVLKFSELPKTKASSLRMELQYSQFNDIVFDESDYEELRRKNTSSINGNKPTKITLIFPHYSVDYVPCDCNHYWLRKALRDFPNLLIFNDLYCNRKYGTYLKEESPEVLECDKWERDGCTFRKSWGNGTVVAICEKIPELPTLPAPLHGLNMSGNGISTLHPHLPHTLRWVDLRHNSISQSDAEAAEALFADGRRVWLGDNLLNCECHNALLEIILQNRDQVEDFDTLTCVGSGKALSEVYMAVLCQVPLRVTLSMVGALLVIAGIAALVWRRYGEPIKIFLYTRSICLWCLRQQDLDDNMAYDAFLSFAHGDEEYVREQLLPGLERAPEQYRVCVHYRDWMVGDWIPSQILRSVHNSRRTVILLSRHFVRSWWSSLEFRYAAAHAAKQGGRPRLLVLVLDDVLEEPLDAELQNYLAYNTYLRRDDPWFWAKLRYALPHRYVSQKPTPNDEAPQDINRIFESISPGILNLEMGIIPTSNVITS